LAEARPEDLLGWTDGRALVATGSPFPPVATANGTREIGQCNNCFLFPGLGFAAAALGLEQITDSMIDAGLKALAERIPASHHPDAALMPALAEAPAVARAVAEAVAITAARETLARRARTEGEALACLERARWQPAYGTVRPGP
ncbi:MAG: malic enzyme-like NAD(P)-binding protein, partial [Cyanobium sp.]